MSLVVRPVVSRWEPILAGSLAVAAREAVEAIAQDLSRPVEWDASLPSGLAGIGVFFAYFDAVCPGAGHAARARERLERATLLSAGRPFSLALHGGTIGVAWASEHAAPLLYPDEDEDPLEDVDRALDRILERGLEAPVELILGIGGLGIYALERPEGSRARARVPDLVEELARRAERSPGGIAWRSTYEGRHDLGVAHGVPGVVGFLARAHADPAARSLAGELLEGSVAWLLSKMRVEDGVSVLDAFAGGDAGRCRTAWCYGDAGASLVLHDAGVALGREDWAERALEVAERALTRPLEATGVVDPGLCHGAAGLGQIANRFYQRTRRPVFREAARAWIERVLAFGAPGPDPGFLTGSAGTGLALLAATSDREPSWDRALLMSGRDAG